MTDRPAALPMYDADRAAVEAWWRGLARCLRSEGVGGVPAALDWPADLDAHWRDPRLLLSQTCGYPLVTSLRDRVRVVGAFRYTAPGCSGIDYRSEIVARSDDADAIEHFRGRRAAVNSFDSHSGSNALRGAVAALAAAGDAFVGDWVVTGSHRQSLEAVRSGVADLAAIDCITLAGFGRQSPDALRGLRVIGSTASAPGLPLITAAGTTDTDLEALRRALRGACRDPALADVRRALFIDAFEAVDALAWTAIDALLRAAGEVF